MIIPSIDIMNGKAVQLRQGKEKVLERENVVEIAREFSRFGEIAVIDLDAALGNGDNIRLIKKLCKIADCRVGGGIRTIERANELLAAGAKKIIIGTNANKEFLGQLPSERVVVAIDTKGKYVVNQGWTTNSGKKPQKIIKETEKYCSEFLFTNVDKEGMMAGLDFEIVRELRGMTKNKMTVAGGITTVNDVKMLEEISCNSQIGMALYTGKIKLEEAFVFLLDFDKNNGLVPTIVQDENSQVLMMAFSSKESMYKTFEINKATYYSRTRKKLWTKGETSGNFQQIIKVRFDCDRDALLFTVKQNNAACHRGDYSCFEDRRFGLKQLYEIIADRINNLKTNSYTSYISKDEEKIKEKIKEECDEVLNYKDRDNLVWEIADLTYFIMILMAKNDLTLTDIENELWRRRK